MTRFKSISEITRANREIQLHQLIDQKVREKFADTPAPVKHTAPRRNALKSVISKSAVNLSQRLKIEQSRKRLIEKLNHQPRSLEQVFKEMEKKKPTPGRRANSDKSTSERVRERFKGFQFTNENNIQKHS